MTAKKDLPRIFLGPDASIRETISRIDKGPSQIALIVDPDSRLIGTVTDGDVRRGLLKGVDLDSPVSTVMNPNPTVAQEGQSREAIQAILSRTMLRHIPIVDKQRKVVDLVEIADQLIRGSAKDNQVVLMAGGLGSRLRPLTELVPKPLLRIGEKPVLEAMIDALIQHGFRDFFIAVNYKAELIKEHFGNGDRWAVKIRYLDEAERCGTAGALSLLPAVPPEPLLVINGDLLTRVNFNHLLDFHRRHSAAATMCVREYDFQVPFGVVNLSEHRILSIDEKPTHRFFVNAGIYVLNSEVLQYVPHNTYFDMPMLFQRLTERRLEAAAFPIREYWIDVGRMDDLEQARRDYSRWFDKY